MTKIHELSGQILSKEQKKVYDKKSPYHGNLRYKLTVLLGNNKKEDFVFAYPNVVDAKILHAIKDSHYIEKRYLFFCTKRKGNGWVLQAWRELDTSHVQTA